MAEKKMQAVAASTSNGKKPVQPNHPLWMAHWMQPGSNATVDRGTQHALMGSQNLECGKATDWEGGTQCPPGIPNVKGASFKSCDSPGEGTSRTHSEGIKGQTTDKDISFNAPRPFDGTMMKSSTHDELDKGKGSESPLIRKPFIVASNHPPYANPRLNKGHDYNIGRYASNSSLLCDTPSTSVHPMPKFGRDWFQKMLNHPGIAMLPSQCIASERTESRKPCFNSYPPQKFPMYAQGTKTMRICTTVDSIEETPRSFPRFAQTTRSLLITKDVNLSKENNDFRTKEFITELNRNTSSDIHSVLPFSGQCSRRGVQLQSLSSSSSGGGKRNIENVKPAKVVIKNESSAETDIMDVDLFKEENSTPSSNYTPTKKDITVDANISPRIDAGLSKEVGCHRVNHTLPDINLEVPAAPTDSTENWRPTSSRTQSLEMDILLTHSEQQPKSNPTMRWIKRLKLGLPNSDSQGTRSSNLDENPSPVKTDKYLKRILNSGIASSEPSPTKSLAQETVMSLKNGGLPNDYKNFVADSSKRGKKWVLAQPWIKRWLRNEPEVTKNSTAVVACDPQKLPLGNFLMKKRQFPSIAAMALMGKAMNGFDTCELQKRGSFTVWNTKAF